MPPKESPPLAGGCTRSRTGKAPGNVTSPPAGRRESRLGSCGSTSWAERPTFAAVKPTACSKVSVRSAENPGRSTVALTWLPEMARLPMPWAETAAALTRTERKATRTFFMSVAPSTRTGDPQRPPDAHLNTAQMQANFAPKNPLVTRYRRLYLKPAWPSDHTGQPDPPAVRARGGAS